MGNYFRVDEFSAEEWTKYGATFSCNNIYQTWAYGAAHSKGMLYSMSRAILFDSNQPVVMAQFRISRIPMFGVGVATANWGPHWRYDDDLSLAEEHLGEFLNKVREEYGTKRGLQIRFDLRSTFSKEKDVCLLQVFEKNGFKINPQIRAYRTFILDLSLDLDVLRANLHSKWRRELGYSEKAGHEVEFGSSVELFDRFWGLYKEMWTKKTFATGVRMPAIRITQSTSDPMERFLIWIVRQQNEDIGAGVFSALGNTVMYFLGASSPEARQNSNPGYLIQWLAVRKAKEMGFRWFDLGGVSDLPSGSGVYKFKKKMNGTYILYPGRFVARIGIKSTYLVDIGEKWFRKLRQIIRKK
jgi:lipid II:glycine glycyltransferase (peptidoglycan interpeptide bridge formation enzyme)